MVVAPPRRKVLLVEFNEITWRIIRPLVAQGKLPTFARFLAEGTVASPVATEVPPHLDPWISWMSVYTGRPREEHGVHFLEQPPETVHGPKVHDLAAEGGRSVGVFGSIMTWPPRKDIRGFWVPSTFSPDTQTFPEDLEPIQELNLSQTRAHTPLARGTKLARQAGLVARLIKLGLKPSTLARLAAALAKFKLQPHRVWEKVSLQPIINFDFFERLYRQHRPDFATFHSNHAAHYMHRYWRSHDPSAFLTKPSDEEIRQKGDAITFGYQVADELLAKIERLVGPNTVIMVASGLGQQPYVDERFPEGRKVLRIRDINQLIDLIGMTGRCRSLSIMAPQWTLSFPDPADLDTAESRLRQAWIERPDIPLFAVDRQGDTLCLNLTQRAFEDYDPNRRCVFPHQPEREHRLEDLAIASDPTRKEGWHDPVGVLLVKGPGIKSGVDLGECSNLDLAPTMLYLLNLPIPEHMKGRVLMDAFEADLAAEVAPAGVPAVSDALAAPVVASGV